MNSRRRRIAASTGIEPPPVSISDAVDVERTKPSAQRVLRLLTTTSRSSILPTPF
jgi:hypothetical protein